MVRGCDEIRATEYITSSLSSSETLSTQSKALAICWLLGAPWKQEGQKKIFIRFQLEKSIEKNTRDICLKPVFVVHLTVFYRSPFIRILDPYLIHKLKTRVNELSITRWSKD